MHLPKGSEIKLSDIPSLVKETKRDIKVVFLHCSASDNPKHDSWLVMDTWHRQRGFAGIAYHLFIRKDGSVELGRDFNVIPSAQQGHNTGSLAICAHGLLKENFTKVQLDAVKGLCVALRDEFLKQKHVTLRFRGHCEVSSKSCPVYPYKELLHLDSKGHMV
jgi:hypothetical protein